MKGNREIGGSRMSDTKELTTAVNDVAILETDQVTLQIAMLNQDVH